MRRLYRSSFDTRRGILWSIGGKREPDSGASASDRKAAARASEARAREERLAFFDRAAGITPLLAARSGELTFLVPTWDRNIGRRLFVNGERLEMRMLERVCRTLDARASSLEGPRGTIVDVGANIGTTALPAVLRHGFSHAVAIEPEPRNASLLRANAVLNDAADRVSVIEAAASASAGTAKLALHGRNSGKHRLATDTEVDETTVDVRVTTLDDLGSAGIYNPQDIGLLWMDVEGHELSVLEGATRLTERTPPIMLELSAALDLDGLFRLGDRAGYDCFADLHDPELELQPLARLEQLHRSCEQGERVKADVLLLPLG